jgi:hypothetical protein
VGGEVLEVLAFHPLEKRGLAQELRVFMPRPGWSASPRER